MTSVELSDSVVDALDEIARLRGFDGPESALEEAIGLERQIALSTSAGKSVLVGNGAKSDAIVQITLPKAD
jgi:hypothetical protein